MFDLSYQESVLYLFSGVVVNDKQNKHLSPLMKDLLEVGLVPNPAIPVDLYPVIIRTLGLSQEQANQTFFGSWEQIRNASYFSLLIKQLLHYISTYGFEMLGIYSEDTIYIPWRDLDIPELREDVELRVVHAYTSDEVREKLLVLAGSGVALSRFTLHAALKILDVIGFDRDFVENVQNRELKIALYDRKNWVPQKGLDWLRYVVYKMSGSSLLIKSSKLIDVIKNSDASPDDYLIDAPVAELAQIFLRWKPIFLALKYRSSNKTFFNRLNKRAARIRQTGEYRSVGRPWLDMVTEQIKNEDLDLAELERRVAKAGFWSKAKLANALRSRLDAGTETPVAYQIRNGSVWVTTYDWPVGLDKLTKQALDVVLLSLVEDLKKKVADKVLYIPEGVVYALPSSEKQFAGEVPRGTYFEFSGDLPLVLGVHWFDLFGCRVDLDFAALSVFGKIGWDGRYSDDSVFWSGDNTAAPLPNGASEMFWFGKDVDSFPWTLTLNFYNYSSCLHEAVSATFFMSNYILKRDVVETYAVDLSNVPYFLRFNIDVKFMTVALLTRCDNKWRVYPLLAKGRNRVTSSVDELSRVKREAFLRQLQASVDLVDLFDLAGAIIVRERPADDVEFVDLSPKQLDKTTILRLLV